MTYSSEKWGNILLLKKKHRFQECPGGSVNEATFKEIYEKFFPYGSKFC